MTPGSRRLDDATVRARCASPEAAAYTLYVRHLVTGPDWPGGQAAILRTAAGRGILPVGYTRQTLSEHLSGRYRHGPPWATTELIIQCLPEYAPKSEIRAQARALHRAAQRRGPRPIGPDNTGGSASRNRESASPRRRDAAAPDNPRSSDIDPDTSGPSDTATAPDDPRRRRTPVRSGGPGTHQQGSGTRQQDGHPALRLGRPERMRPRNGLRRADPVRPEGNQLDAAYRPGMGGSRNGGEWTDGGWNGDDIALDIADLRAECARLTVEVLLAHEPGTAGAEADHLSALFAEHRRSPLDRLAERIDPNAPLLHRALARYLCTYAELGRTTVTELAIRTGLATSTVADILAARRMPDDTELHGLSAVLGVDLTLVGRLAALVTMATGHDAHAVDRSQHDTRVADPGDHAVGSRPVAGA